MNKNEAEEYLLRNHQTGKYAYIEPEKANVQMETYQKMKTMLNGKLKT